MYRLIVSCVLGIIIGLIIPTNINLDVYFKIILPILLLSVGLSLGDFNLKEEIQKGRKYLLFPLVSLVGSILGGLIYSILFRADIGQSLIAAGSMGFYSLPAIMASAQLGTVAGTVVLVVNMFREAIVILFAPVINRLFGNKALIAIGGATTVDVSLSVIKETAGINYIPLSIINGAVLTILVPFIVSVILYLI
jgi:uncharacterized membrane protein YbjE (DUF340 family)